jgi:hypothetical protein
MISRDLSSFPPTRRRLHDGVEIDPSAPPPTSLLSVSDRFTQPLEASRHQLEKMSLTPQDNRGTFIFQAHPALPTPPSVHQQRASFSRPTQGGIRPPGQHKQQQTYSTPYTANNAQPGPARQNGNAAVSAEQQIAQGVLGNSPVATGANAQQRRPQLGGTIHMPTQGTPQGQPMNMNTPINPALSAAQSRDFGAQRQSKNASPAHQNLGGQRSSMSASSPVTPNLGARPQDTSPGDGMDTSQDMSMIDPQLALDQHLISNANNALIAQPNSVASPVVQGEMLSPPPGGSYPTFEALFAAAQAHALAHGYAFVIGRSKRDNRGLKKVFLICDRGGTNKEKVPGEQRQRRTKSRKCGCEFGVFGLENKTSWILRGRIDGEHLTHNHPPSESPTEHPGARKLDPKAIAAVKALEENGIYNSFVRL